MNVLSLFDGISCGRMALKRAGIHVDNYWASEVDRFAIAVSQHNHPDIKHLGDVKLINGEMLGAPVDLMFGGFPCQDFSLAGKQLGVAGDRGSLFYELLRIHKEVKPKWFLYENVKMSGDNMRMISDQLGVEPVLINSWHFSAQRRERYYWTNIPVLPFETKNVFLNDILEHGISHLDKAYCLDANYYHDASVPYFLKKKRRTRIFGQLPTGLTKGQSNDEEKSKFAGLNLVPQYKTSVLEVFVPEGEAISHRKMTVTECERLQTLPDGYTQIPDNSTAQAYKQLGNGWTVDVVLHILKGLKEPINNENKLWT